MGVNPEADRLEEGRTGAILLLDVKRISETSSISTSVPAGSVPTWREDREIGSLLSGRFFFLIRSMKLGCSFA
jgi:hypothetical protein